MVSEPSPVSHRSRLTCASCRSEVILVSGLSDNSSVGVEPALGEPSKNRRLLGSKIGACHPQSCQHVIWSDQWHLVCERHR